MLSAFPETQLKMDQMLARQGRMSNYIDNCNTDKFNELDTKNNNKKLNVNNSGGIETSASTMDEFNKQLSALNQRFNVASKAILEVKNQITSLQTLSETVLDNTKRIAASDSRIVNLERTIQVLHRRVDELERNVRPQQLQISGVKMKT